MVPTSSYRSSWIGAAFLVALGWFTPSVRSQELILAPNSAGTTTEKVVKSDDIRAQARAAEQRGDWLHACWHYDELLRRDRTNTALREAYHRCLRRLQIATRHNDRGYHDALASLVPSQALDVYVQVLEAVRPAFVDRRKSDFGALFQHGLTELRYALEDEAFQREQLAAVSREAIQAFKTKLQKWPEKRLASPAEAREQVNAVLRAAYRAGLPDRPAFAVAVTLEFASGACSGLDEHTVFFSPSLFGDLVASWRGKYAGIGVDLAVRNGELVITHVYQNSPAEEAELVLDTRILRIDQMMTSNLPAYYSSERLRGEVGSTVELEIILPKQTEPKILKLVRRPVVGTVEYSSIPDNMTEMVEYGYLRISRFQKSTVQEVKEALAQLQTAGIKGLILDLRGNPGGAFESAVKVSELFLPEGSLVVLTQGSVKDLNQPFRGGGMNPFALPMVVLVDGETASAAEVLAGGLKEQGRARIIGQNTFGKGTIQQLILLDKAPLQKTPGGIRITVAKFYWPGRSPDAGRGIAPHDVVDPDSPALFEAARQYLRTATGMMMMQPPAMVTPPPSSLVS